MRDYRQYIGRQVSVMTNAGSFQGELIGTGHDTLTMKCSAYYQDDGLEGPTPSGVVIIGKDALQFVQVR